MFMHRMQIVIIYGVLGLLTEQCAAYNQITLCSSVSHNATP